MLILMAQRKLFDRGTLVLGLGIGLAHSLSAMLILMAHLGTVYMSAKIVYFIGVPSYWD